MKNKSISDITDFFLKGRTILPLAIIAGACLLFCFRLFRNFEYLGVQDWDHHLFFLAAPIETVKQYMQFPLWNPWYRGGMVSFQNSQSYFLSPFTLLFFVVPTVQAAKISILAHYMLACSGMYIIAKKLYGLKSLCIILLGSAIFVCNSFISLQITVGHYWILSFAYIPFVFLFFEEYMRRGNTKALTMGALSFALMIFEGGIYPAPFTGLFLGIYGITSACISVDVKKVYRLIGFSLCSFLFSAIKLVPTLEFMHVNPRYTSDVEMIPWRALSAIFFGRTQRVNQVLFEGQHWGWHEYGCYLGPVLCVIVGLGIVVSMLRRDRSMHFSLVISFIAFSLFFFGEFGQYAPYRYLRMLPVFDSLHVTGRFVIIGTFIGSLLAFGFFTGVRDCVEKVIPVRLRKTGKLIVCCIACIVLFDLFWVNAKTLGDAFLINPQRIPVLSEASVEKTQFVVQQDVQGYGSMTAMFPYLMRNRILADGFEPNPAKKGFEKDRPLVYSENPEISVSNIVFSPNRIMFDLTVEKTGLLILNQNYVRGWKCDVPETTVIPRHNNPTVVVEPGVYTECSFYYAPNSFYLGILFSLTGAILLLLRVPTVFLFLYGLMAMGITFYSVL